MNPKRSLLPILLVPICLAACVGFGMFISLVYTTAQLTLARSEGVYPSAEEGMRGLVARGYRNVEQAEIRYAGPNSFDGSQPHVWFVVAEVSAEARSDGSPAGNGIRTTEYPGSFFLQTRDGWVHVQEGAFPEFVGFWMRVFGLAGEGSAIPTHPHTAQVN